MIRRPDKRCEDGVLAECNRMVKKGGKIKFGKIWWQDDRLLPHVGEMAFLWPDYYFTEITVFIDGNQIPFVIIDENNG